MYHLVVGADGVLGGAIAANLDQAGLPVIRTTRRPETLSGSRIFLDLVADPTSWRIPGQVSVAYICAGNRSLQQAYEHWEKTSRLNVENTVALAEILASQGAFVVFPSSGAVFDGSKPFRKPEEPVCPITAYGRQKAEAERQLLALKSSVSVVRFTKMLAPDVPLFKCWIEDLGKGENIYPFSDMVTAPISAWHVAEISIRAAEAQLTGIVHVSGDADVTFTDMAECIASRLGADQALVRPSTSKQEGAGLEALPPYATLDASKASTLFGLHPQSVWEAIDTGLALPHMPGLTPVTKDT